MKALRSYIGDRVVVAAGIPELGVWLLVRLVVQLNARIIEILAGVRQLIVCKCVLQDIEDLSVLLARLLDVANTEILAFDRRCASTDAHLQATTAVLIQHADLVVQLQWVVPGQTVRGGYQSQTPRALNGRGDHDRG